MEHYGLWLLKTLSINANIILYTTKREGVDPDPDLLDPDLLDPDPMLSAESTTIS